MMRATDRAHSVGGVMIVFPRSLTVLAVVGVTLAFAACGDSKPSYCSNVSDLESSVKDLGNVDVSSGGVNALQTQLKKVESSANDVVSSAKGDFPNETSAMSSSLKSLDTAVSQAGSSPSAATIAALGVDVKNVVTAVDSFTGATDSKCS
jgi:hypothetical protein